MANENVVIDLLGTPHTNGVVACAYNQTTNEITCTYADDSTQTLVLNDKHVSNVSLSGTDFVITLSDGTVYTTPLTSIANSTPTRSDIYANSEGQTDFPVVYDSATVDVFIEGVLLNPSEYSAANGTSVVLNTGVSNGSWLRVSSYL